MLRVQNTHPVSEFRAKTMEILKRLEETGEAEILTVNGQARGVIMSPAAFDKIMEELEMTENLAMIDKSLKAIEKGREYDAREATAKIIDKLKQTKHRREHFS